MTTLSTSRVKVLLAMIVLAVGLLFAFIGSILVTKCSDPGGCRFEPIVPPVASGIGLVLVGTVLLFTALRSMPKAK